jgi:histidinol-phosphate aminotransferase
VHQFDELDIYLSGGLCCISFAAVERAVQEQRPKMVFMTSPNNPDGSMISEEDLLTVLALPVLVVLDEAYIEFSEEPSRMRWVMERPNLIVLRTFSKSAGLAGLRVGYGAFPAGMIDYLWRAKQPYNVSVAAETAACAALTNPQYLQACVVPRSASRHNPRCHLTTAAASDVEIAVAFACCMQ